MRDFIGQRKYHARGPVYAQRFSPICGEQVHCQLQITPGQKQFRFRSNFVPSILLLVITQFERLTCGYEY